MSVLPVVSKVLERLIRQQLYDYLQQHSILHPAQSGSRPQHTIQDVIVSMVFWGLGKATEVKKCVTTGFEEKERMML